MVKTFDGASLENFFEEHVAESCGKLIDKSCNAEIFVADDGFFGIENLSSPENSGVIARPTRREYSISSYKKCQPCLLIF